MLQTKNIFFLLVPAIIVAGFALFLSISQYQPMYQEINQDNQTEELKSIIIFPEDPIIGNLKAPKTLIAFEDFGCGRCRDQMKLFNELLSQYPNQIKIIWKSLDVTTFPDSSALSHSYAYCANKQNKFSAFKDSLLEQENINEDSVKIATALADLDKSTLAECLESEELKAYKEKNRQLAVMFGINTVPTIFIDNKAIQEPLNLDGWKMMLSLP